MAAYFFYLELDKLLHLNLHCIAAFQPHQSQEWGGLDIVSSEDSGDAAREQPGDEPRIGLVPDWLRISGLILNAIHL